MNTSIPITGNKIGLLGGGYFDFKDPASSPIRLIDIANGLANTCRFAGQLPRFYSVAEHCVHCLTVAREMGFNIHEKRSVLMHDAAEAFVGDMPSPLKMMLPKYKEIEDRVQAAINHRFSISNSEATRLKVKEIDLMLLKAEKESFWGGQDKWHDLTGVRDCSDLITIGHWKPVFARTAFMSECQQLGLTNG